MRTTFTSFVVLNNVFISWYAWAIEYHKIWYRETLIEDIDPKKIEVIENVINYNLHITSIYVLQPNLPLKNSLLDHFLNVLE
jgi:hypothetical protein